MQPKELSEKYFSVGTRGRAILKNYFEKYRDLFVRTLFTEFSEFVNQVYVNISTIDFSREIKNIDAYIIGTIKIQCRVQLDQALKIKSRSAPVIPINKEDEDEETYLDKIPSDSQMPDEILETQEVFSAINIFKLTLNPNETQLVNDLIDGVSRQELIDKSGANVNTLDTQIRRLRIKLLAYLKERDYSFDAFNKLKGN
ncbi:MAG TPA: hypothetical protein VH917_01040 [Ignavibacteriaceae bacterium]|jgi:hypothetical protein